jgi:Uncharacterized protein conserved in bacteria
MQLQFTCSIKKFGKQGEKTGWTYIEIPAAIAEKLKPGNKKTFRVKGMLDKVVYESVALLPMGDGNFIMALNMATRKKLGKMKGANVAVKMSIDESPPPINPELLVCLEDEPDAKVFFNSLTKGHQKYFSNYINGAMTTATRSKRIAETVNALFNKQNFGQMLRALAAEKKKYEG